MEPLFEAKALVGEEYAVYNIYRLGREEYKAELVSDENNARESIVPRQLIVIKKNALWQTQDDQFEDLGATLGTEIDVFNNGYGDILGRLGIR